MNDDASLLSEINKLCENLGLEVETGVFSNKAIDEYIVLTSIIDTLELYADNTPSFEVQEVRISIFTKTNYTKIKKLLTKSLLEGGFTITDRRFIGREDDTGYYHYVIDVEKGYKLEEE